MYKYTLNTQLIQQNLTKHNFSCLTVTELEQNEKYATVTL